MNYSVYILFGNDKGKADDFMGDTGRVAHVAAAATAAISDAVGVELGDYYADKLLDKNSVALTSNVTEMTFNTSVITKTNYQVTLENMEDVGTKILKHTLTVKGNLEYPNILFKLGIETAKRKDTSRIWKWANTPLSAAKSDDANKKAEYYRDVVATVFANDDRQFRAIHLKDATVGSYDEYYDKNGEGHFTLVINKIVTKSAGNAGNENADDNDIAAKGPEFKMTFSAVTGDIAKAANTAGKLAGDAADVSEKVLGKDNAITKSIRAASDGATMVGGDMQKYLSDGSGWSPDNIASEIDEKYKYVKNAKELDNQIKGKETNDTTESNTTTETLKDGTKITTETVTNPDGSKVITTTTTKPDGTKTVTKETIAAKDEGIVGDAKDDDLWKWKKKDE